MSDELLTARATIAAFLVGAPVPPKGFQWFAVTLCKMRGFKLYWR
jgi:hypothetical protein